LIGKGRDGRRGDDKTDESSDETKLKHGVLLLQIAKKGRKVPQRGGWAGCGSYDRAVLCASTVFALLVTSELRTVLVGSYERAVLATSLDRAVTVGSVDRAELVGSLPDTYLTAAVGVSAGALACVAVFCAWGCVADAFEDAIVGTGA
jgi:hypothetical protein